MKYFKPLSIFLVLAAMSTSAFAAGLTAKGTIEKVDPAADTIILADGSRFVLTEGLEAETFRAGQKVTISYEKSGGKSMASAVKISQ